MKQLILPTVALFLVGLAAYATKAGGPTTAPATQPSGGTPVNKFCAVEHADEIDPKVTVEYKGKTIGFCCKDCIPKFQADPDKYMATLK